MTPQPTESTDQEVTTSWPLFGYVTAVDIHRFCPGLTTVDPDDLDTDQHPTDEQESSYSHADLHRFAEAGILLYDPDSDTYCTTVDAADQAYRQAHDDFTRVTQAVFGTLDQLPDAGACRVSVSDDNHQAHGLGPDGAVLWTVPST